MDIKELSCFKKVYEDQSINKASKSLFMTSQGVSRIITKLEQELDTQLFLRTSKGVVNTKSADVLYENVNELIEQFQKVENAIALVNSQNNKLRISCARGVLNALSIQLILDFIAKNPQVDVEWEEQVNEVVKEEVEQFKVDIGFIAGDIETKDISKKLLARKEMILLVYEGHPLYDRQCVKIEELKKERFLLLNEQYQSYHDFYLACERKKFEPNVVVKTADSHFLFKLCKQKLGIGVLLDFSVDNFKMDGVKVIRLNEKITWDIYQVVHEQNNKNPSVQLFCEYIKGCL